MPKQAVSSCLKFNTRAMIHSCARPARCAIPYSGVGNPGGVMAGTLPQIVIVGGGFGGLYAALSLKRLPVEVTLLDRRNFHLFQPLLYQVATGGLSPANIAAPLRAVLSRQANTRVLLA